ncbi:hypothetical protein YC2023_080647 [Brassica napus]
MHLKGMALQSSFIDKKRGSSISGERPLKSSVMIEDHKHKDISLNRKNISKKPQSKEEDISICECKFDFGDPDSACGERCLNVITNTECTPGYCPCGVYCKNQVNTVFECLLLCAYVKSGTCGCTVICRIELVWAYNNSRLIRFSFLRRNHTPVVTKAIITQPAMPIPKTIRK